ncbi:FUM6p [Tolypocladium paradoxum]|uniref:FUM6p n=1 Tax=Tolypocladium paradoxum TaxID=94208 RepID=A0A2S4L0L0_9HYPO|nr:FUM6p [Tolypocladium paradoxum]
MAPKAPSDSSTAESSPCPIINGMLAAHKDDNLEPIPGPRPSPFLGNLLDFDFDNFTKSLGELGKTYGE